MWSWVTPLYLILTQKENWIILTNKEIHAMVKKPTVTETVRLN
jgi:hypothetical protein